VGDTVQSTMLWDWEWWGGLNRIERRRGKDLDVSRRALVVKDRKDPDQYVQKGEIINREWHIRVSLRGLILKAINWTKLLHD